MNKEQETHNNPTLVLGGTGKTGRRIVERLKAQSVPVRIGSRSGIPPFEWQEPSAWNAALQNVASVYISYHPDLAAQGAAEAIESLVKAAAHSGVQKLVLLSGRGENEAQHCEQIVRDSGIDWTIVRCSWFNQNFSENFLRDMVMGGMVALPIGDVKEPFVDAEDIADVAVAALTDDRHSGQLYELTGPTLLTFPEAVGEIAKATGRDIRYQQIGQEEFMEGLAAEQLPEDLIQLLDYLFTTVLDGRNAHLADGVQRALGREPGDFATYASNAARQGYWNPEREALATA